MGSYRNQVKKFYKINQYIDFPEVRLIDEDNHQIGVLTIAEAREKSHETGLDLVEINGKAKPPVIKLIDFAKFKYQESKKSQQEKKGAKGGDTKELQMTPFIGQVDFDTRVKKAIEFLTTGNKVKLSIKFQGRQIARQEFGHQLAQKFLAKINEVGSAEGDPKLIGKRLILSISPAKKKKEPTNNENSPPQNQN